MSQHRNIEKLYSIFAEQDSNPDDVVLTRKGAEELLDKINEIIEEINNLRQKSANN